MRFISTVGFYISFWLQCSFASTGTKENTTSQCALRLTLSKTKDPIIYIKTYIESVHQLNASLKLVQHIFYKNLKLTGIPNCTLWKVLSINDVMCWLKSHNMLENEKLFRGPRLHLEECLTRTIKENVHHERWISIYGCDCQRTTLCVVWIVTSHFWGLHDAYL